MCVYQFGPSSLFFPLSLSFPDRPVRVPGARGKNLLPKEEEEEGLFRHATTKRAFNFLRACGRLLITEGILPSLRTGNTRPESDSRSRVPEKEEDDGDEETAAEEKEEE